MDNKRPQPLNLAYVALFAVLLVVCSWLCIPTVVPFTLQTFAVFLTAGLLGSKRAAGAVLVFLFLGMVGLPVFSGFAGGAGVLFGPTGGYLIGFVFTALMAGLPATLTRRNGTPGGVPKTLPLVLAMVAGMLVYYAFGTAWFLLVYAPSAEPVGLAAALSLCVFPFILPDLAKIALATALVKKLSPHFRG